MVLLRWARAGQVDPEQVEGTAGGHVAKQGPRAGVAVQDDARDDQADASTDLEDASDLELEHRRHDGECPTRNPIWQRWLVARDELTTVSERRRRAAGVAR